MILHSTPTGNKQLMSFCGRLFASRMTYLSHHSSHFKQFKLSILSPMDSIASFTNENNRYSRNTTRYQLFTTTDGELFSQNFLRSYCEYLYSIMLSYMTFLAKNKKIGLNFTPNPLISFMMDIYVFFRFTMFTFISSLFNKFFAGFLPVLRFKINRVLRKSITLEPLVSCDIIHVFARYKHFSPLGRKISRGFLYFFGGNCKGVFMFSY